MLCCTKRGIFGLNGCCIRGTLLPPELSGVLYQEGPPWIKCDVVEGASPGLNGRLHLGGLPYNLVSPTWDLVAGVFPGLNGWLYLRFHPKIQWDVLPGRRVEDLNQPHLLPA